MKNILIIIFDSPHIDRRTLLFAKTLKGEGYGVRIMAPAAVVEPGFEDIEIINIPPSPMVSATKVMAKKYAPKWFFNIAKKIYKRFKKTNVYHPLLREFTEAALKINADIYIACDLPALPVAYEAKKANGGFLVYDAHEFYTGQAYFKAEERKSLQRIEAKLTGSVDLFITVNEDIAGEFKRTYGVSDIKIILNAITPAISGKNYLHDLIGVGRDTKIALFQGGFCPYRNLPKLVETASFLEGGVLVMLGWGDLEGELKELARRSGALGKKIFFVPKVAQSELLSYSGSAFLGVIPYPAVDINTKYCTPNKLFEFVTAGVPVVANSELVTVKGFIDKYGIGFPADFNKPESAARVINKLFSDDKALDAVRKNLPSAAAELSWEKEGGKLIDMVNGLQGKGRKAVTCK